MKAKNRDVSITHKYNRYVSKIVYEEPLVSGSDFSFVI